MLPRTVTPHRGVTSCYLDPSRYFSGSDPSNNLVVKKQILALQVTNVSENPPPPPLFLKFCVP